MEILHVIFYILIGGITGIITGLLGGGSGPLLIPILVTLLSYLSVPAEMTMHLAVGTALSIALLAMLASLPIHHKKIQDIKKFTISFLPGGLIGTLLGTALATYISGAEFKLLFGIVLLLIAGYTLLNKQVQTSISLPNYYKIFLISLPMGLIATCFGVGMGPLCIPLLKKYNFPIAKSIAIASFIGSFLVLFATFGFILAGSHQDNLPKYSLGYIYLPMVIWIGIPSIIFSRLGSRLAHKFSPVFLKFTFIIFLLIIGAKMITTYFYR